MTIFTLLLIAAGLIIIPGILKRIKKHRGRKPPHYLDSAALIQVFGKPDDHE